MSKSTTDRLDTVWLRSTAAPSPAHRNEIVGHGKGTGAILLPSVASSSVTVNIPSAAMRAKIVQGPVVSFDGSALVVGGFRS